MNFLVLIIYTIVVRFNTRGNWEESIWELFILILHLDRNLKLFRLKTLKDFRITSKNKANLSSIIQRKLNN